MRIQIQQLKRYFGKTKAVDEISFEFTSGQVFGFVGPNGSGKSTTMRILATLDEPTDGDCFIDGWSVTEYPEKARKMIGYMPDSLPTHRDMNVHDYLDFFARSYGIHNPRREQVVESVEEFANLMGIREKHLYALSKGMKQRVSLARSLLHDPSVLILDEPAAGLDPRARIELRELLKILCSQGKAILISSHILTELAEICNGAVIIERGKILKAGTLQQILAEDMPRRTVQIRTMDRTEELYKEVLLMPNIQNVHISDHTVEAEINGEEDFCCQLLAGLISRGHRIVEFKHRRNDLEQVFMNVTRGEVQ